MYNARFKQLLPSVNINQHRGEGQLVFIHDLNLDDINLKSLAIQHTHDKETYVYKQGATNR